MELVRRVMRQVAFHRYSPCAPCFGIWVIFFAGW